MDNITHSLIGATMGEGIRSFRVFRDRSPKFLSAVFWAAVVGNNFPDADFIINGIWGGGKLGYLLHHRGYTHTLIALPVEAVLTLLIAAAIGGVRGLRGFSRSEWIALFWISLAALGLHIGADFMNDYGVHPFAPFWPHWVYGGVMFIVEPLLWAALLPLLLFGLSSGRMSSKVAGGLGISISVLLLGLLWFGKLTTWPVALATTLYLALGIFIQKLRRGVAQPIVFAALVVAVFSWMGHEAVVSVREQLAREQPEEKITQLVTTPSPGNPFCWQVIPVTRLEMDGLSGQEAAQVSGQLMTPFFERVGALSFWPAVFPPETCAFRFNAERTAPLMKASLRSDEHVFWLGEFRGTTESLAASAAQYCRFEQYLRWARVPFYFKMPGNILLGGDLRYDHEPGQGFAELEFSPSEGCLSHAPNWDNPSGLLPFGLPGKR